LIPGYRNVDTLCISQLIFNWTGWQEKAPYEAKAAQRKLDYEKVMKAYNKKQESVVDDEDEESDKSNSVVNDEDDEETGEGEEDDDEDDD
jgi:high mobility group protein B1